MFAAERVSLFFSRFSSIIENEVVVIKMYSRDGGEFIYSVNSGDFCFVMLPTMTSALCRPQTGLMLRSAIGAESSLEL